MIVQETDGVVFTHFGHTGYGKCAADCTLGPRCGDGVVQADQGEQCDDGNLVDGDGCSASCKITSSGPK